MFCGNCGNQLKDGEAFCARCGVKVGTISYAPEHTKKTEIPVGKSSPQQAEPLAVAAEEAGKSHKKILIFMGAAILMVIAVILVIALIVSNGKDSTSSKVAQVLTNDSSEDDDDDKPVEFASGIYQPDSSEHRFETIMEEIQANKQITITNSESGVITAALDENIKSTVFTRGDYLPKLKTDETSWDTEKYFTSYCIVCMDPEASDGRTLQVFIDPEQKIYTNVIVMSGTNDTEYMDGITGKLRMSGYFEEHLDKVPDILTPDKWTFLESTTEEINGSEYYCEKYSVTIDGTEHKYNIAFDGNGDIVYMGSSSLNKVYHVKSTDTPGEWIDGYYVQGDYYEITVIYDEDGNVTFEGSENDIANHKEDALQSIENGYSRCENDLDLAALFDAFSDNIYLGRTVHVNHGQYASVSIKPTFDTEGFDISTYEYVPSLYDFLEMRNAETVKAIEDELTGWF